MQIYANESSICKENFCAKNSLPLALINDYRWICSPKLPHPFPPSLYIPHPPSYFVFLFVCGNFFNEDNVASQPSQLCCECAHSLSIYTNCDSKHMHSTSKTQVCVMKLSFCSSLSANISEINLRQPYPLNMHTQRTTHLWVLFMHNVVYKNSNYI